MMWSYSVAATNGRVSVSATHRGVGCVVRSGGHEHFEFLEQLAVGRSEKILVIRVRGEG